MRIFEIINSFTFDTFIKEMAAFCVAAKNNPTSKKAKIKAEQSLVKCEQLIQILSNPIEIHILKSIIKDLQNIISL